jgi:GWxTD domain-containing protein
MRRLERNDIDERRQAIRELERATLIDPQHAACELLLARVYYQCGFLKYARQRFERVARMAPGDADGSYGLGQVWRRDWLKYLEDSSLVRSIEHFSRAARLRPGAPDAWLQMVPLLIERGDSLTALRAARQAMAAEPRRPECQLALAYTSYRTGDVVAADTLFHQAVPRLARAARERFEDISPVAAERDTAVLRQLSRLGQKQFVERFWRENDPDLASPENEALLEYWARVAHAYFLFFDARRREWDMRGEVYVRYGPPKRRIYNPVAGRLDLRFSTGPSYPANLLVWEYPELGMAVSLQDRTLNEIYVLPMSMTRDVDPAPDPDSLARRQDSQAVRGGRGVFPKLPPGVRPLDIQGAIARFESPGGARVIGQVEVAGGPADSLWADWIVLDSTRSEVARGGRALSPSACDATTRRVADFAAELHPGEYLVGLTVRDGRGGRGVFRSAARIERPEAGLDLSDIVIACGAPVAPLADAVRIEPNPGARVTGAGPLTAYFEIYHLAPAGDGQARFEYVYTVKSAEKDPRVWLQRLVNPRRRIPDISVTREAENVGPLRRQFVTVPVDALPVGRYRVEVAVRDLVAGTEVTGSAPFVKLAEGNGAAGTNGRP